MKKELVIEKYLTSGEYIPDNKFDFEAGLQDYAKRCGYALEGYGKSIDQNIFEHSAQYTWNCIRRNPKLSRLYNQAINGGGSSSGGYGGHGMYDDYDDNSGYSIGKAVMGSLGLGKMVSGNGRRGSDRSNSGRGGYGNGRGNSRNNKGRNNSENYLPNIKIGWIIGIIVALVLFYKLVGPAAYTLIMEGGLARILIFVGAVFFSWKVLTSKNMGWPIYIKAVVLFAIWLVILNY